MKGELKVKDEIESRQKEYIDVLQNEVKTAKRILGNNKLRDKIFKDLNFEQVYYYEYKPKHKEEGKKPDKFDEQSLKMKKPRKASLASEGQMFSN